MTIAGLQYRPSGWGLVRIAAFVVAILWVIGLLFPAPDKTLAHVPIARDIAADPRLRPALAPRDDGRGVLDYTTLRQISPQTKTIAWVGGSSTMQYRDVHKARKKKNQDLDKAARKAKRQKRKLRELLPSKVLDELTQRCDLDSVVDVYINPGMRTLDQYIFLQHVLATKPTALILTLNPYWAFNDFALNRRQDVFPGALYRGVDDELTRFWSSVLGQPSDFAYARAARVLPVVRDRWDYHRQLFEFWQGVQPNIQGTQKQRNQRKRQLRKEAQRESVDTLRMSRCAPDCINVDPDGASYRLLRQMFEMIRNSGVNAVVYEAPLNLKGLMDDVPDASDENLAAQFASLLKQQSAAIRTIADEFSSPSVSVITADDWEPDGLKFNDVIHLSSMGNLPQELTDALAPMVGCGATR